MIRIPEPHTDPSITEYLLKDLIGYNVTPAKEVFFGKVGDVEDYFMCTFYGLVRLRNPMETWSEALLEVDLYEWVDLVIKIERRD